MATLHIDRPKNAVHGKIYTRPLLCDSYRAADVKVKPHILANLSPCTREEIRAIELALQHEHQDLTVEAGLQQLDTRFLRAVMGNGPVKDTLLPQPSDPVRRWLDLAQVLLPQKIQRKAIQVAPKQKLQSHRTKHSK